MEMNFLSTLTDSGMSLTDLADFIPKIQSGLEMLKSKMPLIKDFESTLGLKEGETLIYSLIPVVTENHKEILIRGFVMSINDRGETVITREAFAVNGLEKIEEIMSKIPKMGSEPLSI